ncbi:hypothetical protein LJC54_06310 [Parabacteroides sp. OttesenSCG-928-J18]|nr:hypothetical protein [Parabacteroides sp. OttesenSCG-928-J18]
MKKLLLLFCCFTLTGAAQEISLQELVGQRKYKEVLAHAETLSEADSTYTNLYAIGQAYEGLLRYPQAYQHYMLCLKMDSTNVDILNTLGRMAVNMGRAKDAEHYFSTVLQTDSTNFYANYQIARLHQQLGNYETAVEWYEKLRVEDEDNPVLLRNIGDCFTRMEIPMSAVFYYFLAYSANRENVSLASSLINTMLRLGGDYIEEAIAICDTAVYYNPDNRLLQQNRGMALFLGKLYAEADTTYSNLMAAGDSTYLTIKYAGASRYYAGQFMNSIEPLEYAYEMDSTSVEVCLLLGSALGKTYDRKRAYELLDKAEQNMKPNPVFTRQLLRFRAETYRKDGKYDMADKLYYKAWQEDPQNTDLLSFISGVNVSRIENYSDETARQKGLFIRLLYVKEALKIKRRYEPSFFHYHRYFFESLYNDMFFRSVSEEPMLSPDGKKSVLHLIDLRQLINELPEVPEKEKETMDKNFERFQEARKEQEKILKKNPTGK